MYRCNNCDDEVFWDDDIPGYDCGDPECCNDPYGGFIHLNEDCGQLLYAVGSSDTLEMPDKSSERGK